MHILNYRFSPKNRNVWVKQHSIYCKNIIKKWRYLKQLFITIEIEFFFLASGYMITNYMICYENIMKISILFNMNAKSCKSLINNIVAFEMTALYIHIFCWKLLSAIVNSLWFFTVIVKNIVYHELTYFLRVT